MRQNQGEQGPHRSWWMQPGWLTVWIGLGLVGVLLVLSIVIPWMMTGFVPRASGFGSKTLWDWLQLLVVPSFLLLGGFAINQSAAERDRRRTEDQQRIADRNAVER